MTTTKQVVKKATKQKNPKYRVHPGLSITAKDLRSRIKNNSISLDQNTDYSLDETITTASRMSKAELLDAARKNHEKIESLKAELQKAEQAKNKAKSEQIKKDLTELEELRKQQKP